MVGRIARFLVGLAVLVLAADIWRPAMVPHGIPVRLGDFEDARVAAAILLLLVALAFILAAIAPAPKPKRRAPVSMSAGEDAPAQL